MGQLRIWIDRLPNKRLRLYAQVLLSMTVIDGLLGIGMLLGGETLIGGVLLGIAAGFGGLCLPLLFAGYADLSRILTPYYAISLLFIAASYYGPGMNLQQTLLIGAVYPFVAFAEDERRGRLLTFPAPLLFFLSLEMTDYSFLIDHFGLQSHRVSMIPFSHISAPLGVFLIVSASYYLFSNQSARYERRLHETIGELELARVKDTLLSNDLTNLVRTICHDIANPLTVSMHSLAMTTVDSEVVRQAAYQRIERANNVIKDIINNVRKLQALKLTEQTFKTTEVSVPAVFEECAVILEHRLKEKDIKLEIASDEWFLSHLVKADKVMLCHNVLNNLLTNAIKFSERGAKIELKAIQLNESQVLITVKDWGIGIPDNMKPLLFDPAAGTSRRGTANEPGTGFGLPIVKTCLTLMGGEISVISSTPQEDPTNHGTEFAVVLEAA